MVSEKNKKETVVLKTEFHCDGCVSKLMKFIRGFDGVEKAETGEGQRIMVVGDVDPVKLRQKLEEKAHRKVEIISPVIKNSKSKKEEEKKKESTPTVTTAVMKLDLHCHGCIKKIQKTVSKIEGLKDMKIDRERELLIVTGSMNMKALAELLQKQLMRAVEILPQKKEGDKKSGGDKAKEKKAEKDKVQTPVTNNYSGGWNPIQGPNPYGAPWIQNPNPYGAPWIQNPNPYGAPWIQNPNPYGSQFAQYPNPYGAPVRAPQTFSDENPNVCCVM